MGQAADRELLNALFETAADSLLVFDADTLKLIDFNPAACTLYGYSPHEMSELSLIELSGEPAKTLVAVKNRRAGTWPRLHRRSDGSTFPVEISANWFESDGSWIGVGFVRDVSERRAADAALEASEAKFAAAFRVSPDSVNINRMRDGFFIEVNEGFTKLTGFTPGDVAGKTSSDIHIWNDPADRDRLVDALRKDGEVTNLEAAFRRKDGTTTTALMSARIITLDGEACILSVTRDISDRKSAEQALERTNEQLASVVRDVAEAMGRAVETRDPYTQGHQRRVARLGSLIAAEMGLDDDEVAMVDIAGLLHDVGKLAIPAEILSKPGRLSAIEFNLIQEHPAAGYEILRDIPFPGPVAPTVLQHHERMDGSGYPSGAMGSELLVGARILAVADVVEAISSHRPYRPSLGLEVAIAEVRDNPTKYDVEAVDACLRLFDRGTLSFLRE